MKIETIKSRIESFKNKLVKAENKLERILKAEQSNYQENNPYYYDEWDKKSTLREIEDIKMSIEKYEAQLTVEVEKSNSRNVQIIVDFLQDWRETIYREYEKDMLEASQFRSEMRKNKWDSEEFKSMSKVMHDRLYGSYEYQTCYNPYRKRDEKVKVKVMDGMWEHIRDYFNYNPNDVSKGLERLFSDLVQEANRKYDFIISRVNKYVGEIVDADNLTIGSNGELNGIIIGKNGKCKVNTIIANGPIRIAHFRVLVKEVK